MSTFKNRWSPEQTKANRELWVDALRSGKYTQTKRHLSDNDGFCCLGVACDIFEGIFPELLSHGRIGVGYEDEYRDMRIVDWYNEDEETQDTPDYDFNSIDSSMLPTIVQQFLGLTRPAGEFMDIYGEEISLASKNDDGETFDQIAHIIAAEPKGLINN